MVGDYSIEKSLKLEEERGMATSAERVCLCYVEANDNVIFHLVFKA